MISTDLKRDIRTVGQGDPGWLLDDGFVQYPRAALQIQASCPDDIKQKIQWAVQRGYVKCIAHVQGKELTWQTLTK